VALPTLTFPVDQVKFRHGEKYVSLASNHKFLGTPYGVYVGFDASVSGTVVSFAPDPACGFSFIRVLSTDDSLAVVDIFSESTQSLDFADWIAAYNLATPGVVFPVYILARASYQFGQASTAEFFTRLSPAADDTEVLIGVVSWDGNDLTINTTQPFAQSNPFAWSTAPLGYGFMREGAAADLITGLSVTAEVEAARQDLSGFTWPTLNDRLIEDLSGPAMAGRLARSVRAIQSNDYVLAAPTTSLNVSGSFGDVSRSFFPALSFPGGGTEDQEGVITGPSDTVRNIVVPVESTTFERPIDDANDRNVVFGRLAFDEIVQSGTSMFNGGGFDVTGTATLWLTELEPGDLIQGADGSFYEVASITSDVLMTLVQAYGGVSGNGSNLLRRRFTLTFRIMDNATEVDSSLDALTFRFFFPAWVSTDTSVLDGEMLLHSGGEPPPLPAATTAISGKVLFDPDAALVPDPRGGAVREVKDGGVNVADNVHELNFLEAVVGASPGVIDVTQRGPSGPQGPAGSGLPGPAGPAGPPGVGFSGGTNQASSPNYMMGKRAIFDHQIVPNNTPYEHIVTAASVGMTQILWATVGVYFMYEDGGGTRIWGENWRIVNCTIEGGGAQARIQATTQVAGGNATQIGLFLNVAGV
jgi:hypothetical protein